MKTCSAAETHWPVPSTAAAQWERASGSFLFLAVDAPPALLKSCPNKSQKQLFFTFTHIPAC
eukprot:1159338-Pelagomonas_calceolata.AAC.9